MAVTKIWQKGKSIILTKKQKNTVHLVKKNVINVDVVPVLMKRNKKGQFIKGDNGWLRKHHSKLSIKKNSESHLGKKLSEETKKKISISLKGKNTWLKGKKLTEEHKKKISPLGRKHTEETKDKMRLSQLREKGHNWRGGKTPERFKNRWKQQKRKALKRDNFTCICGKTKKENGNRELDVHHKIPFRCFKDLEEGHKLDNLITLCRQCHLQEESKKTIINSKFGKNPIIWNYVNIYNSDFGDNVKIASFTEIGDSKIGNNCKFEAFSFIPPGYTIEDNVFWGPHSVGTNDKYPPSNNWGKTLVKRGAVIGANTTILPGITIGKKVLIGAGSVVTKSIPDGEIWWGNPAQKQSYENHCNRK